MHFSFGGRSFINAAKSRAERIPPCGTDDVGVIGFDLVPLIQTIWVLSEI